MQIQKIALSQFRNFDNSIFEFNQNLTVIVGENARGKTNLLEAVHCIVMGTGFRESREDELIKLEKDHAILRAKIETDLQPLLFEIHLRNRGGTVEKIFMVQKARQHFFQYKKETGFVVLFSPEQIRIMNGPPEERRSYINTTISLYDNNYKKKLVNYENAVRKRNKLLQFNHDQVKLKEELIFWNTYLEDQAQYIVEKRKEYIAYLNTNDTIDSKSFEIEYKESHLSRKILDELFEEELRYKKTLVGPQKDEFFLYQKEKKGKKNLHHFGSRSEQRLAVLWLKINEIKKLEERYAIKPILLLDDIFSELDIKNKHLVVHLIKNYQTIMTTTEDELVADIDIPKATIKL